MKKVIVSSLVLCLLSSCYGPGVPDPYIVAESRQKENQYYAPSAANAPLLREQYDLSGGVHFSSGSEYFIAEMQTAYMPGKHFGIMATYNFANLKTDNYFKSTHYEIGAGYITNIDPYFHFETYGGFGGGNTDNQHYTGTSSLRNNYVFLQPTIAVSSINRKIQFAFFSKFAGNHFGIRDTSFTKEREPFSASQFDLLQAQPFHLFWEPGLIFRFGGNHFLFHVAYSISKDLTNSNLWQAKDNFSAGFTLRFNAHKVK